MKQIVVTAPAIYNTRLCKIINDSAMQAIPFPVIETDLNGQDAEIDVTLKNIKQFDWIALPSRNAIKAVFERAKALNLTDKIKQLHFCAIGKDQEYLRTFGVTSILKNTESSPQGIVEALKRVKEGSIAVFAPKIVGMPEPNIIPNFIDSLQANHWKVTRINAYTTKVYHPKSEAEIIKKIKNGQIDLVAFTSTGEIEALLQLIGGKENLRRTHLSCFGPYTFGNAEKLGLKPVFMATDFSSFQGYVRSIKEYFRQ